MGSFFFLKTHILHCPALGARDPSLIEALLHNENVLTTPADLYATMVQLLGLGVGTRGKPAPTGEDTSTAVRFPVPVSSATAKAKAVAARVIRASPSHIGSAVNGSSRNATSNGSAAAAALPLLVDADGDTRGQSWSRMVSVLGRKLPLNRTCTDAGIPSIFCLCLIPTDLDVGSEAVRAHTQVALAHARGVIDALKPEARALCHDLELAEILEATEQVIEKVSLGRDGFEIVCQPKAMISIFFFSFSLPTTLFTIKFASTPTTTTTLQPQESWAELISGKWVTVRFRVKGEWLECAGAVIFGVCVCWFPFRYFLIIICFVWSPTDTDQANHLIGRLRIVRLLIVRSTQPTTWSSRPRFWCPGTRRRRPRCTSWSGSLSSASSRAGWTGWRSGSACAAIRRDGEGESRGQSISININPISIQLQ
jgi:hypothetical protein